MKNRLDISSQPQTFDLPTNPAPTKIGDHFVGKSYASGGEPVYFTMQKITPENQPYLQQYVNSSKALVGYNSGLLVYLAEHTVKIEQPFASPHYVFSEKYTEDLARQTGFSEIEFNDFINFLGQRGFHASEKQKIYALSGNAEGSEQISLKIGHYITYASKIPNFSIESLELLPENSAMTLKAYREKYSNLLLCVSSWPSAFNSLQNRGIFKNPGCVVIDGGYRDIALSMHGFIAAVVFNFLDKENITVQPVSSMQHMILKAIRKEDISFASSDNEASYEKAKQISENFRTQTKVHELNIIKVSALAKLYYKNSEAPINLIENKSTFFSSIVVSTTQQANIITEPTNDSSCCTIL